MPVGFNAFYRVVHFEAEVFRYLLQEIRIVGHLLDPWVESRLLISIFLDLLKPGMLSYIRYGVSFLWISIKNVSDKVFAFGRHELRHLVVSIQDFLV